MLYLKPVVALILLTVTDYATSFAFEPLVLPAYYRCTLKVATPITTSIVASGVTSAYLAAPTTRGASGFPHAYGNVEKYQFPKPCNKGSKTLMEFLALPTGTYNADSNPRDEPGDFRAIYFIEKDGQRTLCGAVAHMPHGNASFTFCDPPPRRFGFLDILEGVTQFFIGEEF